MASFTGTPSSAHRKSTVSSGLLLFLLLSSILLFGWNSAKAQGDELTVDVTGVRSNKGKILISVYRTEEGFPSESSKAFRRQATAAVAPTTSLKFSLPAGTYAIAVLHDEDSDGTTATNFLGIPKEGVGASNDAKGRMGPPKFKDARFNYAGGRQTIRIQLGY